MRNVLPLLILGLFAALLAGCPAEHVFTSADPGGGGRGGTDDRDTVFGPEELDEGETEARELTEPDVIRRAGNLLYILNQYRGLSIVDLDSETLIGQAPAYGYPRDLYLEGDRAYVLVAGAREIGLDDVAGVAYRPFSRLYVIDVADPGNPEIINRHDLAGDLVDSRLAGGILYVVGAEFRWWWDGPVFQKEQQRDASWVTAIDIRDPEAIAETDQVSFAGMGDIVYATSSAICVASADWTRQETRITYVDISDPNGRITVRGAVSVPGMVADRFKMDIWEGTLRVVSHLRWPEMETLVTTVDVRDPDRPELLGQTLVEGASGETLFATRFDGPTAYIVTFFIIDPLFIVDLSDPRDPRVTGELEVPGWSTHIEARGDYLIALGVDDTAGRQVSVSLFDVRDPAAPALSDRVSFGGQWAWSSAYQDVKAFTVLEDTIIVPFSGWEPSGGYDRLQFIEYTPDSLSLAGTVDVQGHILRSFAYGGEYYAVTTEQLAMLGGDAYRPAVRNSVTLAEYVADYLPLGEGLAAEIVTRWEGGATTLRVVARDGAALGEIEIEGNGFREAHVAGDLAILVQTLWEGEPGYRVTAIDCARPASPRVVFDTRVAIEPWWGGWWGWRDGPIPLPMPEPMPDRPMANAGAGAVFDPYWRPWPPFGGDDAASFVVEGRIVLRGSGARWDRVLGGGRASQGVAILDLASGRLESRIGFGFDRVQGMVHGGDALVLNVPRDAGRTPGGRPLAAHYVYRFEVAPPALGPGANVPGAALAYHAEDNLLLLEDWQYLPQGGLRRILTSASWDGGPSARLLDRRNLPDQVMRILARPGWVFYDSHAREYVAHAVAVAPDGALRDAGSQAAGAGWSHLLEGKDGRAYISSAGMAIVRCDFRREPVIDAVLEVMQAPLGLRFGEDGAYAALGYAGVAHFPE